MSKRQHVSTKCRLNVDKSPFGAQNKRLARGLMATFLGEGLIDRKSRRYSNSGFAELHQGPGYFKILGRDQDITDEGIKSMLGVMDRFTASANARPGFSITYDLRGLRNPSMQMVLAVAEWGTDPQRKETWETLNQACKVVVNPGFRFSACKGVLTTFFFVCPPIVRTFLLTDPDESEDNVGGGLPWGSSVERRPGGSETWIQRESPKNSAGTGLT